MTKADLDELQRMNERINHLYRAFIVYCYTPKALCNHVGGGGVSPQPEATYNDSAQQHTVICLAEIQPQVQFRHALYQKTLAH